MKTVIVNLAENTYPIYIEPSLLQSSGFFIKRHLPNTKKIFMVTDRNVAKYYVQNLKDILTKEGFEVHFKILKAGEKTKNISVLESLYNELAKAKITRSDAVLALGGGVIGDLAGFLAATYLRGVKFIQVPTSLLAQVDSSVGGKVAIDLEMGKNLVGSFYHPALVIIDPNVLETLDKRFLRDGLAEVIKYAFIKDKNLYDKLNNFKNLEELEKNLSDIIYTCCDIKRAVVESDEKDTGERMILNFGHTLGHAIETVCGYETYTHGEGVAIGMSEITKLSEDFGFTEYGTYDKIVSLLKKYELPTQMPEVNKQDILKVIELDKKNIDQNLNVILLKEIGKSYIYKTNTSFFGA
ncbi:3-dehydroquinate synthase [Candidatus Epulonipiscioides gigas]|nr:3-dehydroquinate synthase [Epulopiscium sp. SCG-C07WGA-EpuloA2]